MDILQCTVPGKPEVDPGHEDYADGRQVEVEQVVAQGSLEHNRHSMSTHDIKSL